MKNKKNTNKKTPEIFKDYFEYHNPLFLIKDLFKANLDGNEKIASWVSNLLIDLKNDVDKKNPENENLNKTISIFEKFLTLIINKKVEKSKY